MPIKLKSLHSAQALRGGVLLGLLLLLFGAPSQARVETEGGPPIFGALANANFDSVREQIAENPDLVKAQDAKGQTLLHLASEVRNFDENKRAPLPELVKLLLEKGADPNARDKNGESALHHATWAGAESGAIVKLLIDAKADVNLIDNAGLTPLYKAGARSSGFMGQLEKAGARDFVGPLLNAVRVGDREEAFKLLNATPALSKIPDVLRQAVAEGQIEILEFVLKNGANVNERDLKTGRTPLFEAALRGPKKLVELLLKSGADVKIADTGQRSVVDAAQQASQWEIAALLVKAGATSGARYGNRNWLLEDAAIAGNIELITALLDAGEEPDKGNAVQKAIARGHDEAAKLLVARGASVEADGDDFWGRSPLHIAAMAGNPTMIEWLLQKGASLDATAENGDSALALSARFGHRDVVELLLGKGANPNASQRTLRPRGGEEPIDEDAPPLEYSRALHYALAAAHCDLVEVLVKKGAHFGDPIFDAVLSRDVARVQALVKKNPALAGSVRTQDTERGRRAFPYETMGFMPLHVAAIGGDAAVTRVLLEAGAAPDAPTSLGKTALHFASASGDVPTVQVLLAKGADAKSADKSGATALHFAAGRADSAAAVAVSTLLVKSGADLAAQGALPGFYKDDSGAGRGATIAVGSTRVFTGQATPLHFAALLNKVSLVKWLLDNGAPQNAEKVNWTPLHLASRGSATESAALLLARGADVHAVAAGRTPLHEAIAPLREYSPMDDDGFINEWNSLEGRAERFWKAHFAPLQISPAARATIALLLKNGADPLAIPYSYNATDRMTPLDLASRAHDRVLTSTLVAAIKDVNQPLDMTSGGTSYKLTALKRAAFFADQNAVELLVARRAELNYEDIAGRTALDEATNTPALSMSSNVESTYLPPPNNDAFLARRAAVAAFLKSKGAQGGGGALQNAVTYFDLARVRILVKTTPALLKKSGVWGMPLIEAVGKPDIMKFLIESGIDMNLRDDRGYTALYHAAQYSNVEAARLLLDKGADMNAADLQGRTPLAVSRTNGQGGTALTTLLQERGAREEIGINYRISRNDIEGVKAMLAADPGWAKRITGESENTSLHVVANGDKTEIAALLLENGADIAAINRDGFTPLHRAVASFQMKMVEFLLEKGADVNFDPDTKRAPVFGTTNEGLRVRSLTRPVIFQAISGRSKEMISLLLEKGAKLDVKDQEGMTPLQFAIQTKNEEIIAFLREKGAKE